jgi:hypothetical protein
MQDFAQRADARRQKVVVSINQVSKLPFESGGLFDFVAGRYADTVHWQEKGLLERPAAIWVYRTTAPALALLGRRDEARAHLSRLLDEYRT